MCDDRSHSIARSFGQKKLRIENQREHQRERLIERVAPRLVILDIALSEQGSLCIRQHHVRVPSRAAPSLHVALDDDIRRRARDPRRVPDAHLHRARERPRGDARLGAGHPRPPERVLHVPRSARRSRSREKRLAHRDQNAGAHGSIRAQCCDMQTRHGPWAHRSAAPSVHTPSSPGASLHV